MLKAKKNSMYIDVTGVDDMTDRSTLMEEIIRRNCDVDPRIINSLVNKLGRYGDENHMMNSIMAVFNESYNDKYAGWNEGEELLMLNDVRCGIR